MARADIQADIDLDSSGFRKGITKAKKSLKQFSSSASASFVRFGAAFAGVGLVKGIVNLGTAAAETASKFEAVFGSATKQMNEEVQKLRETIPATTAEVQNSLATFAQMAKAFGMGEEQANKFSVSMTRIAGDLASFHNLETEEVFTKISAAISGEFEPLKRLGIVINEARLKQEALNLGLSDGKKALTASQKAITVQSIVVKDMGSALGDAARTADSAANKIKFLKSEITETGADIGVTLIPAILELTKAMGWLLDKTKGVAEGVGAFLGKIYVSVTELENGFAGYDGIFTAAEKGSWRLGNQLDKTAGETKKLADETVEAVKAEGDFKSATDNSTESLEEKEKALKSIQDQIKEYYDKQKEAIDLEREQFVNAKELEVLQLRAAGNKKEADALQLKIDKMEKAIEVSDKYGISLKKAAILVENISRAEAEADGDKAGGARKPSPGEPVDDKVRGKIRVGKITTGKIGGFQSRFGRPQTMRERERAAGLYNTTLGRDGRAMDGLKARDRKQTAQDPQEKQVELLQSIDDTLKEDPS